jgi:hypothetical protein
LNRHQRVARFRRPFRFLGGSQHRGQIPLQLDPQPWPAGVRVLTIARRRLALIWNQDNRIDQPAEHLRGFEARVLTLECTVAASRSESSRSVECCFRFIDGAVAATLRSIFRAPVCRHETPGMHIAIDLPRRFAQRLQAEWHDVSRRTLEAVVVEGYRDRTLTRDQVGQGLGLSFWEAESFLKQRHAYMRCAAADLDEDRHDIDSLDVR